jgi:uncharacterized membrane protein
MQMRMRDTARRAAATDATLPAGYWLFLLIWIALGCVAFLALITVYYLMVAKPL